MYVYKPDIVAQTKIPGHIFVNTNFTKKFVPPAIFLGVQTMLTPMIYLKGNWSPLITVLFLLTFLVPATTAISGRWFYTARVLHAPFAYLSLLFFGYFGGITEPFELLMIIGMNIWFCIYWAIMGAGLSDPLKRMLEILDRARNGDFTSRVSLNFPRTDELGKVAHGLNELIIKLENQVELAQEIAKGRIDKDIEITSDKDTLNIALNTMVQNINLVIGEINKTGSQIALGTDQLSDSSRSLSQGSIQQAASLEEVTSAMTELASQTKTNAEHASQANQLSTTARDSAENGNAQMQNMISAMSDITESSKEIAKIIKAIDDIAFQTNLLALNAAVEAARAGKQGKGFAVVAQEVRNLAGRSAKAAQETAELIDSSVKKVELGTEIVNKTAQALGQIVEGANKVSDLVDEIAIASNEQALGISQINQGLSQIEHVTQQNTANAEQTASSAEQLSGVAKQLQVIVSRFKLKEQTGDSFSPQIRQPVQPAPAPRALPQAVPQTNDWGGQASLSDRKGQSIKPEDVISLDDKDFTEEV